MINEISEFIVDYSGSPWILGENAFVGYLPQKNINNVEPPERSLVILERTPGDVVPDLPDRIDKAIQLWNRSRNYQEAMSDAMELFVQLHGDVQWDLPVVSGGPEYTAMIINAVASPAVIENPDGRGLFVFSTNYIFMIMNKNA